jgi:hypothetical protein
MVVDQNQQPLAPAAFWSLDPALSQLHDCVTIPVQRLEGAIGAWRGGE